MTGERGTAPGAAPADGLSRWLDALGGELEPWELERLSDPDERADALSGELAFGTGGLRAQMGAGPARLNRLTVERATQGLAEHLLDGAAPGRAPLVCVAHDTRRHSRDFALAAAGVLAANGARAFVFPEAAPTPELSFAVRELGCDAGVVITASHNPMEYNGYKVYGPTGCQATDALCRAVAARIAEVDQFSGVRRMSPAEAEAAGLLAWVPPEARDAYLRAALAAVPARDASGLLVTYSPLGGTGLGPVPRALERLGARVSLVGLQCVCDGTFPGLPRPNPEDPAALRAGSQQMLAEGADLLLATDPDADRLGVVVNHLGSAVPLSGNDVGLLLLDWLGGLADPARGPVAVTTIVSAPLADAVAAVRGVELRRTLTGFKYAGEQLDRLAAAGEGGRFLLGLEESCGYLAGAHARDKDGVQAAALVCALAAELKARGSDLVDALADLHARCGHAAARQLSLELPGARGRAAIAGAVARLREDPSLALGGRAPEVVVDYAQGAPMPGDPSQALPPADVLELRLAGGAKVLARPSGTEPKLKCYLSAPGATEAEAASALAALEGGVTSWLDQVRESAKEG